MASGSVWTGWPRQISDGVSPAPPRFSPTSTAQNTQAALAPTQTSGPLGSSFGLGLPAGYAAALTQYLDPAAMDAQINADAYSLAGHTAADQGWGEGDGRKSRLAGEIAAPALQAYRMNLLNQVPQFWQMEQQQQQAQDARADRAREISWERQQQQWAEEDRAYDKQVRNDARRDAQSYRNSGYAPTTGANRNVPGAYPGSVLGDGYSSTASISGGPAVSSSTFGQSNLASHKNPVFGNSQQSSGPYPGQYETKADAEARGAKLGGGPGNAAVDAGKSFFDFSGSKNNGGFQVQGVPTSGPSVKDLKNAGSWAANYK